MDSAANSARISCGFCTKWLWTLRRILRRIWGQNSSCAFCSEFYIGFGVERGTFTGSNLTSIQNEESAKKIEFENSAAEIAPQLQTINAIKASQTNRNTKE